MRKVVKSTLTVMIALVGIVGGAVWAFQSNWAIEPIILMSISFLELVLFIFVAPESDNNINPAPTNYILNEPSVNVSVNVGSEVDAKSISTTSTFQREAIIDLMKSKVNILFIDDDKNFNVVKILKTSGWKNTRTVVDIKNIDIPVVKETDIFFVDVNGVGRLLDLPYEGLDLALMLKQRYPIRKVVIYSANKKSENAFHEAWTLCDYRLEKNALPYQFQNLVEQYCIEMHNTQ